MSKTPAIEPEASRFEETLEAWCAARSATQTSPELIGSFYASEKAAGTVKDFSAEFEARFTAFLNRPA